MDGVIYLKECPVCVIDPVDWWWNRKKPLPNVHTRYGVVSDPLDVKNYYDYLKENANEENQR